MRTVRLFLVKVSPAIRPMARAAARQAFPDTEIIEVNTVQEAAQNGAARHPELLVLAEPESAAVAEAVQSVESNGLPRWAVVILGRDLADLAETVPPEEWNAPLVARVFRSALLQHDLLCENLRLQGDLRTIARRITHDLYTPIGCIHTCSHVLKVILPPNDLPSSATMVRNINESLVEVAQILDRVSFMLRASADSIPPFQCEMAGVVADVLSQLEPQLQQTGAKVAQPESWPEVNGVPPWLQVIWWNLLNNAIKHGGPTPQIRMEWAHTDDGYRFSVADRGSGVAPAMQAGLFRPFDQLHLFTTPGLGLPIVQRLVALQGGRCGYERLDDGSSRFYFTLPATPSGFRSRQARSLTEALHSSLPKPADGSKSPAGAASLPGEAKPARSPGRAPSASVHSVSSIR